MEMGKESPPNISYHTYVRAEKSKIMRLHQGVIGKKFVRFDTLGATQRLTNVIR